ncbi:MAG: hypothetical protein RJP95_04580, partial [Pirellulales bacterium]
MRVTIDEADAFHFAVTPALPALLRPILSVSRRSWPERDDHRREVTDQQTEFFAIVDGSMVIPSGFFYRVYGKLERHGVEIELKYRHWMRAISRVDDHSAFPDRLKCLADLQEFCRGRIVIDDEKDIPQVIAGIADMYPDAQIAVCTSSNKQAQKLLKKLSSLSDREVVIDNSRYVPEARIVEKRRF